MSAKKTFSEPPSSEITPEALYFNRRAFLKAAGLLVAFRAMTRAGTPLDPRETPKLILTTGIYRLSRNPIYLSMGIFVLGVGILADTLWVVVLAPVIIFVMERGVIAREEKYLERKFGATYLQYKAAVRRWI